MCVLVCPHVTRDFFFYHPQMQHSHALLLSLSVQMGGASPAGGFVMDLTIVVMVLMNCLKHVVR